MKIIKISSRKTISFDFDDTLTKPEWDEENEIWSNFGNPREENLEKMRELSSKGYRIIIVTARNEKLRPEIEKFVEDHDLPVEEIYCTNGELKGPILKSLGVIKHFDDCPHEIASIDEVNEAESNPKKKIEYERAWHPADCEKTREGWDSPTPKT
jgi:phosphoserine phosphatase